MSSVLVSVLLVYNTGAKFQLLCFSIYWDITDFVFLHHFLSNLWRHQLPNLHNTKSLISLEREKISEKGKHDPSSFWKAFHMSSTWFSFHRQFKERVIFMCSVLVSAHGLKNEIYSWFDNIMIISKYQDTIVLSNMTSRWYQDLIISW